MTDNAAASKRTLEKLVSAVASDDVDTSALVATPKPA